MTSNKDNTTTDTSNGLSLDTQCSEELSPTCQDKHLDLAQEKPQTEEAAFSLQDEYTAIVKTFTRSLILNRGNVRQSILKQHVDGLPTEVKTYHRDLMRRHQQSAVIEDSVDDATYISLFVDALDTFSNFLNPTLIEDAIEEYGDGENKQQMEAYQRKLQEFKKTTTFEQFSRTSWKGDTPPRYKEIEIKITEGKQLYSTMADLPPPKLWIIKKVFSRGKKVIYAIPKEDDTEKRRFIRQNSTVLEEKDTYYYDSSQDTSDVLSPDTKKLKIQDESPHPKMFRFSQHTEKGIIVSYDGTKARRKNPDSRFDGGVYVNTPLSGMVDFEIEVIDLAPREGSLWLGIAQSKKGTHDHLRIPYVDKKDNHTCTWAHDYVCNNLKDHAQIPMSVNLDSIQKGDRLGIKISTEGELSFTFNGEDQGVEVKGVYSEEYDTYIYANLCDNCNAVRITKAGRCILHDIY